MGSDRLLAKMCKNRPINFNPRSRMGSDPSALSAFVASNTISIHAPAWGATMELFPREPLFAISIHAPAWGATATDWEDILIRNDFNPRSRMGSDCYYYQD